MSAGRRREKGPGGPISERLEFLFSHVRHADGREFTQEEVASYVSEQGYRCSDNHVSALRRGLSRNPTVGVLQSIARFFEVGIEIFDDDSPLFHQMKKLVALRGGELDMQRAREDAAISQLPHQQQVLLRGLAAGEVTDAQLDRVLTALNTTAVPQPPRFEQAPNSFQGQGHHQPGSDL